jgi:hypothetical protein
MCIDTGRHYCVKLFFFFFSQGCEFHLSTLLLLVEMHFRQIHYEDINILCTPSNLTGLDQRLMMAEIDTRLICLDYLLYQLQDKKN